MLVVRCKYRREELSRVQRDGGYHVCSAQPHTIQRASMALTATNEKIAGIESRNIRTVETGIKALGVESKKIQQVGYAGVLFCFSFPPKCWFLKSLPPVKVQLES